MNEYITPERIANAIMQDSTFIGHYVIVEGFNDFKVFDKFLNQENVRVKCAFHKENMKMIVNILEDRNFKKKIGIIDSDFDQLLGANDLPRDIIRTDDHDLEVTIFKTEALENLVNQYCSKSALKRFSSNKDISFRDSLFILASKIGILKLASLKFNLKLCFRPENINGRQIKYHKFINFIELKFLGYRELIKTVVNYSRNRNLSCEKSIDFIFNKICEIEKFNYDIYHIVNGHDLSNILLQMLKKSLKCNNRSLHNFQSIESNLILAYDFTFFQQSRLCANLLAWAKTNGFSIFKYPVLNNP